MKLRRCAILLAVSLSACASLPSKPLVVTFPAEDGVRIGAYSYGQGRHGVVLVPGGHGIGETWDRQARRLARAGFRVLAIDYRGLGQSGGTAQDDSKVPLDVFGAVRQLRSEAVADVSVVGASWGGSAAAAAAIQHPGTIDRIVLLSTGVDSPERLTGRKLFVVARDDREGSGDLRLEAIQRQYALTPGPKKLVVVEGSAHAQFLFLTPQGERVLDEIVHFLSER
jgi:dipeptidyl aminopeptidase/acylaminoacyl peptidase